MTCNLKIVSCWIILCFCTVSLYARNTRVYGYVVDQDNIGIELANVAAWDAPQSRLLGGVSTNKNGYYELLLEETDTVVLTFSMIGYTTVQQRVLDLHEVLNINVQLLTDEQLLTEIEVRGIRHTQGH